MPPCKKVLCKKIQRANYLAKIIKSCNQNFIDSPEGGWTINECNEMEIDYFDGNPFPENITNISIDHSPDGENDEDENEESYIGADDECEDDENWDIDSDILQEQ